MRRKTPQEYAEKGYKRSFHIVPRWARVLSMKNQRKDPTERGPQVLIINEFISMWTPDSYSTAARALPSAVNGSVARRPPPWSSPRVAIQQPRPERHLHVHMPALSMTRPRSLRGCLLTNSFVSSSLVETAKGRQAASRHGMSPSATDHRAAATTRTAEAGMGALCGCGVWLAQLEVVIVSQFFARTNIAAALYEDALVFVDDLAIRRA